MGGGGVYSFVVLALINSVFLLLEICFAVLDYLQDTVRHNKNTLLKTQLN
jgi:hypothetical protein